MSSKRNCVARSSSIGEIGVLNQVRPIESPANRPVTTAQAKPSNPVQKPVKVNHSKPPVPMPEEPRRSIFTFGSPDRESKNNGSKSKIDEGYGVFLEACFRCKKKIPADEDVYMYGYLGAFCSPECREDQIALDEMDTKPTSKSIAPAFAKLIQGPSKQKVFGSHPIRLVIPPFN